MKIIFVRHGETDANLRKLSQGHLDSQLTELGIKQAEKVSERLKNEHFDIAYSSDSSRAVKTAEIILRNHPDVRLIKTDKLREQCKGKYEGTMLIKEREEEIKAEMEKQGKDYNKCYHEFRMPSGEGIAGTKDNSKKFYKGDSMVDLQKRVAKFYLDLIKKHFNEDILIVSHGRTIASLFLYIFNKPFSEILNYLPENSSVTIIEIPNQAEPKKINIKSFSDINHLKNGEFKNAKELYKGTAFENYSNN